MNIDNLVLMANQIGGFFDAMPDHDEAVEGVSNHIRKFWALRMRKALAEHWHGDGSDLLPIVQEALKAYPIMALAEPLEPPEPRPDAERHEWDGASEA